MVFLFLFSACTSSTGGDNLWICSCASVFALCLRLIFRKYFLWTGNSGYSRLICNDALCKSIAIFHLIDKSFCHMTLKSLVLTTHTVSMVWRVSISFYVWHNGTQYTIDRRRFLLSLCQAHDTFFLTTDILHNVKLHASLNKRVFYSWINKKLNASLIQRWPVMSTWMCIPKKYILNHNITYETTKNTSLLSFESFVRRD